MTQDHREPVSSSEAVRNSRRGVLRALGVGGATGLLAVAGLEALAGERPHQRLQDRTPQRNRKQRNKRQNNKNNNQNNNQTSGGGGLGGIFDTLGTSVAFRNLSDISYEVYVLNSDQLLECGPGYYATLYAGSDLLEFVFRLPEWGEADLQIGASNPAIGDPWVEYGQEGACDSSDQQAAEDCYDHHPLDVGDSFAFAWQARSFTAERQSDSSDYKMFLVTALGD